MSRSSGTSGTTGVVGSTPARATGLTALLRRGVRSARSGRAERGDSRDGRRWGDREGLQCARSGARLPLLCQPVSHTRAGALLEGRIQTSIETPDGNRAFLIASSQGTLEALTCQGKLVWELPPSWGEFLDAFQAHLEGHEDIRFSTHRNPRPGKRACVPVDFGAVSCKASITFENAGDCRRGIKGCSL